MPFDPQTSEMTNRIRRGFGQRGALGVHVDEVAVPVIPIYGLDQAPFRTDGVEFHGQLGVLAVAAQLSHVHVVPPSPGRTVIRQLIIANPEAAAQRYFWGSALASAFPAVGGLFTSELEPAAGNATADAGGGIAGSTAAAFVGPGQEGSCIVPAGSSLVIPMEWTLPTVSVFFIQTASVNVNLQVSVRGQFWR